MFKITPNPPEKDSTAQSAKSKAKQQDETTQRVLDHYLLPKSDNSQDEPKPGQVFTVVKGLDNECLLANLSETLASADAMANELAFDLEGSPRSLALGIQQMIELSSLLANQVLDNVDPR
ncbi:hypothetical protein E3Z27_23365 [Pseudomonas mediterranea]|uniref:DUF3077 domain-containing protein n=1 Tax=Pseudomonas mediterranea TaxID=183795 RepID=A0AAX2D925_9PSED|nr:DUF6124 family protein [Pseudomonas mediterranea]KGU85332.1 hypothetical protein N005_11835 [Pseudomonas mediterranea CFBP 5447]MBL0844816.1 hypothetical protein [Pseudomonas mediterranea]MDU9030669.1 DUF6124 family protein [Pseudomonas mediterranea]QHA84387.1 hypothetical protein E3Z27_23365 [Pseudomonas mediterranea]UZE00106.1 DUF6124 family protein [Pseudomonas mediterranea]